MGQFILMPGRSACAGARQFNLLLGRLGRWECSRARVKAGLMNEARVMGLAAPVISTVAAWAAINGNAGWAVRQIEGGIGYFGGSSRMGSNMPYAAKPVGTFPFSST